MNGWVMSASSPAIANTATNMRTLHVTMLCVVWGSLTACGDPSCPAGTMAEGKFCRHVGNNAAGDGSGSQTDAVGSSGTAAATPPVAGSSGRAAGTGTTAGAIASPPPAGGIAGTTVGAAGLNAPNMSIAGMIANNTAGVSGAAGVTATGGSASTMSLPAGSSGAAGATGTAGSGAPGVAGTGSACTPVPEACDNQDNDCDGKIDETVTRVCGMPMPPCKQGTQACTAGVWATDCTGEIKPTKEECDGVDNDCDGTPDNGATCSGSTPFCAGTAGCVQCNANSDCTKMNAPCKQGYCNSAHQCAQQTQADHVACSGGVCSQGSCISGCIDDTDCKSSSSPHCDPIARSCVRCFNNNDSQCPSGMTCSSSNTCVPACGNGRLDSNLREECDPKDPKETEWTCNSQCKRLYIYTPCSSQTSNSSECGGASCTNIGPSIGVGCIPGCSGSGTDCTEPNGKTGYCIAGCLVRCNPTAPDCPPGSTCMTGTVNGTSQSFCG
jgi:hypothetical protein